MPARAAGSVSQRPEPQAMAGPPAHAGGPARTTEVVQSGGPARANGGPSPRQSGFGHAGGPAISKRSPEERISLNEAFKKPPVLFRPEKKEHRKVNVDELKKIIDETVNKKEEE